jgi:transcriptional regulator with XRE-family HTH domain
VGAVDHLDIQFPSSSLSFAPKQPLRPSVVPFDATGRVSFGPRLKRERERRGLSLETIAESTKIKGSLLAALERDDVSHWPRGIFRRAFVRSYAEAIGLQPEIVLTEFLERFPDPTTVADAAKPSPPSSDSAHLRLTLADSPRSILSKTQALAAILDVGVVLLVAGVVSSIGHANPWAAIAIVGLGYFTLTTASLGRSLISCWLMRDPIVSPFHADRRRESADPSGRVLAPSADAPRV